MLYIHQSKTLFDIYHFFFFFRYTEARKDREKFRKRLVEVIMHRDEWDDEDAEPGTTR